MKYPLLFIVTITLFSCSKPVPKLGDRLDSLFSSTIPGNENSDYNDEGPGASILIVKGDSIIFSKSYGLADLKTKEPITDKTLFNLGSISKTFVANAILMLRDEGKLSLEDSVIKYFPEFKNKEIGRKVKIKHLLTHTSGLPDIRPVQEQREFYLTADDAQNWAPIMETDTLEFEPGTKYNYSNPAFNGLALIIEKVSGQKWQSFVADRIFKPAGMTTSTITDGPHPQSGVSHGYTYDNDGFAGKDEEDYPQYWGELDYGEEPTFCAAGNGGVWSSTAELLNYHRALNTAMFSNAKTIAESMELKSFPQWSSKEQPFIGWSWFIGATDAGASIIYHTGTQGGFYCDYVSIPGERFLYVMLANFPIDRDLLNHKVLAFTGMQPEDY